MKKINKRKCGDLPEEGDCQRYYKPWSHTELLMVQTLLSRYREKPLKLLASLVARRLRAAGRNRTIDACGACISRLRKQQSTGPVNISRPSA